MSEHKFQNDEMLYSIADYFKHQGERTERFAKYLYDDMQAYKAKVEEMQKALEWYANEDNYNLEYKPVMTDKGKLARQALKGDPK